MKWVVWMFVSLLFAAQAVALDLKTPSEVSLLSLFEDPTGRRAMVTLPLLCAPWMYVVPQLRVAFFNPHIRAPYNTYVISRWVVQLVLAGALGYIAAFALLSVIKDARYLALAGVLTLVAGVFACGAAKRLRAHPCSEFTVPCFPFSGRLRV